MNISLDATKNNFPEISTGSPPAMFFSRSFKPTNVDLQKVRKPKYKGFASDPGPIRILHLSDLHIKEETDIILILQPLLDDIRLKPDGIGIDRIDYVVISGDIINSAGKVKFNNALDFISRLLKEFNLDNNRCIIVPGNHDLHWNKPGIFDEMAKDSADIEGLKAESFHENDGTVFIRNETNYNSRFEEFSDDLYQRLYGREYPLDSRLQFDIISFHDMRIQFLALNSCCEIDCYHPKNSAISNVTLAEALLKANSDIAAAKKAETSRELPTLRIAIWHHPVSGTDAIKDTAFLEKLRANNFKICLHGHSHKHQQELFFQFNYNNIYIIGAGTSGVNVNNRPSCSPYEYNLLEIDQNFSKLKVHTRCKRTENGAWEGWALWKSREPKQFERQTYYEIEFDKFEYAK